MNAVVVDEQRWPLVVVCFNSPPTDGEFASAFRQIERYLEQGKRHVTIVDLRKASAPAPAQRKFIADWLKRWAEELRKFNMGTCFVFSSPVFRFVLSGIFLVQPPPSPHMVTGAIDDGMRWANERLRQERWSP